MRILMTADTLGGVWTYASALTEALAERGCETVVAALGREPTDEQLAAMPSASVLAREGALEWMPHPWKDVEATGEWLLDVHDDVEPDIVHLNGFAHAPLPWRAPVLVVAHSCVLSWFESVRGHAAPHDWNRYRLEVERGLRAAEAVAAPTKAMLTALERHYDFQSERFVIPNGLLGPPPRPKQPFVLSAGRAWDEAKNVAALERVAARLPWPVRIAGEGSALGHLPARELERWYAEAAIFALPASYEPFGLAALEAGAAGCALVLGDIPSLREVWGDAAIYVDPHEDEELERALRRLIEDEALRNDLARAARERAAAYTPERMGDAYLEVYERLLVGDELPAVEAR